MKILVLGITGMLGSTLFKSLSMCEQYQVIGTMRRAAGKGYFADIDESCLATNFNVLDIDALVRVFESVDPDVVINCIGLIKQHKEASDPLVALPINALLPHRLSALCKLSGARLIHFSTDCVFSGKRGMYAEDDLSDAEDLYGKSKFIGEVSDAPHAVTLRTSIIGHELNSNLALLDWFLSQKGMVKGYSNAVFSGLTTVEMARVVKEYVLPAVGLSGVYHVSVNPISKLSLLRLVAEIYKHDVDIIPD
jgi:dTDP-4-dehydrorhamnose reductase